MTIAMERLETALAREHQYDFRTAKKHYSDICDHCNTGPEAATATERLQDMDDLIAEKEIY